MTASAIGNYLPETIEAGVQALAKRAGAEDIDDYPLYRESLQDDVVAVLEAVGYGLTVARAESGEVALAASRSYADELHKLLTETTGRKIDRLIERREAELRNAAIADGFSPDFHADLNRRANYGRHA